MPVDYGYCAGGNITACRIVIPDTAADYRVIQATAATAKPIGIAGRGSRNAPYNSLDDGYLAIAGERLRVYHATEICYVEVAATITRGDFLMTNGSGQAIVLATSGNWYVARALHSGISGQLIEVEVIIGQLN